MKKLFFALGVATLITGCSSTYIAPTPVSSSDVCWKDVPVIVHSQNSEGLIEYRTCRNARTRNGTPMKLELWLERVAETFCAKQGGHYKRISERSAFPDSNGTARVELVFVCTKNITEATQLNAKVLKKERKLQQQRYQLLKEAQELYANGALTKEEFLEEKARIMQ